jgi:ketosteroid isomerase-like protein
MSENLDLVRSIYADWERGDYSRADWADANIDYVIADGLHPDRCVGLDAMARAMRHWLSAWTELSMEAEEYRELDPERVMVLHRFSANGKTSGVDVGRIVTEGVGLFHVRDGKVTQIVHYYDRDRALADLGLEE